MFELLSNRVLVKLLFFSSFIALKPFFLDGEISLSSRYFWANSIYLVANKRYKKVTCFGLLLVFFFLVASKSSEIQNFDFYFFSRKRALSSSVFSSSYQFTGKFWDSNFLFFMKPNTFEV